jgi:hypothetical protein
MLTGSDPIVFERTTRHAARAFEVTAVNVSTRDPALVFVTPNINALSATLAHGHDHDLFSGRRRKEGILM